MNKKKKILLVVDVLLLILLIVVDQVTKYFAINSLADNHTRVIWEGVFELHYLENKGAAFAIGNLIDRLRFGYVVDFLYFSLINFPVFNVADICVTLSSIYLVILLVFVYKESDLEFLTFRTKKFRDIK